MKMQIEISKRAYNGIKKFVEESSLVGASDYAVANGKPIGLCKECSNWCKNRAIDGACLCSSFHTMTGPDFFCGDFEKTM